MDDAAPEVTIRGGKAIRFTAAAVRMLIEHIESRSPTAQSGDWDMNDVGLLTAVFNILTEAAGG